MDGSPGFLNGERALRSERIRVPHGFPVSVLSMLVEGINSLVELVWRLDSVAPCSCVAQVTPVWETQLECLATALAGPILSCCGHLKHELLEGRFHSVSWSPFQICKNKENEKEEAWQAGETSTEAQQIDQARSSGSRGGTQVPLASVNTELKHAEGVPCSRPKASCPPPSAAIMWEQVLCLPERFCIE